MHVFIFFFLKWGLIGYSLGIVRWDFTWRDHPRNLRRISWSGPVNITRVKDIIIIIVISNA